MKNSEIIGAGQDTARRAPKKYKIIYADPPWKVQSFKEKADGLISRKLPYQHMSDKEIMKLPISKIADVDSILFMWVIDNRIPIIAELFSSWGFAYKCVGFVWAKKSKTTSGFNGGFSSYTKRDCEFCFIGTRGKYLKLTRGVNQILLEPKTIHSKKPDEIRKRIVRLCGDIPRIELFARQRVDGWDAWGNEIEESPVMGEKSPAQDTVEICHTAPNNCSAK